MNSKFGCSSSRRRQPALRPRAAVNGCDRSSSSVSAPNDLRHDERTVGRTAIDVHDRATRALATAARQRWRRSPSLRPMTTTPTDFNASSSDSSIGRTVGNFTALPVASRLIRRPLDDFRRHANRQRTGRHVVQHNRVGADLSIVADRHLPDDLCPRSDIYSVQKYGRRVRFVGPTITERDALANDALVADSGVAMNHDAALVLESPPAGRVRPCRAARCRKGCGRGDRASDR